jgi:hypothetical protein
MPRLARCRGLKQDPSVTFVALHALGCVIGTLDAWLLGVLDWHRIVPTC